MRPLHSNLQRMAFRLSRQQRGAVLIISLLLLIVMTLIGVTGMRNTTLEEKMAGNSRDLQLAFNAAEAALRQSEVLLQTPTLPAFVDALDDSTDPPTMSGDEGYYNADTRIWKYIDWSDVITAGNANGEVLACGSGITGVAEQPVCYIEEMPAIESGGSLEAGTALEANMYRITVRAVGGSDTAEVVLQATFRR